MYHGEKSGGIQTAQQRRTQADQSTSETGFGPADREPPAALVAGCDRAQ